MVIMEKSYIYEVTPDLSDLNENGFLKPYAYQNLFAKIAEEHLSKINLNMDTTIKYNLAWALISLSFEIVSPVRGIGKLFAQTWHSGKKGPYYRRELVFKNSEGDILFQGSTFSILLDLNTRAVYRKKETPFPIGAPIEEITIKAQPTFKSDIEFTEVEKRKVYNSHIDCLGHVNNIRYGEFAYDALTEDEKNNLENLKRYEIYFLSELRSNENFSIMRAYINDNDNSIIFRGTNLSRDQHSFDVIMSFK
jgi:medium-chain acyl-[acyl-carrier-protein] hydrolase